MGGFVPGLELAEGFYREVVAPILATDFAGLRYSAALIGSGSEILGYDSPRSMDHHWGPKLQLFVPKSGAEDLAAEICDVLGRRLPVAFRDIPTNFGPPDEIGVRLLRPIESGPVQHMVAVTTIHRFFWEALGVDPHAPPTKRDWLLFPQQRLLEMTAGRVFHDDLGLAEVRARLAWYPHDVWLYLLSGQWKRISQEEAFLGRTGEVGDEIGSAIVAARLVRDLMRLVFFMERRYAPYSKWLGTAFSRLPAAPELEPVLHAVLHAETWKEREAHLTQAYRVAARMHNDLRITTPLPTEVSLYHDRPFLVIHAERFAAALKDRLGDAYLRSLPDIGGVDQVTDNTDVLSHAPLFRALSSLYEPNGPVSQPPRS